MAYLTDTEKRLLFSALTREKEVCKKIDDEKIDDGTCTMLVPIIESLERKFRYDNFEQDIYEQAYKDGQDKGLSDGEFIGWNEAIDKCIKILDTKEQKYNDVLNDRYDMIEYLRGLKSRRIK